LTVDERLVDRDWGGCLACNAVFAVRLVAENIEVSIIYIYYIHPELRIENYRFRSGKGAGPL